MLTYARELFSTLKKLLHILEKNQRSKIFLLIILSFVGVCGETAVVGLLAAFASIIANPKDGIENLMTSLPDYIERYLESIPHSSLLIAFCCLVVLSVLAKNVYQCWFSYFQSFISASISSYAGYKFIRGLLNMPYVWHLKQNSSDLVSTFYWRDQVGNDLLRTFIGTCSDILLIFFLCFTLMLVSFQNFIMATTISISVFLVVAMYIRPKIGQTALERYDLSLKLNKNATEIIHGIRDIMLLSNNQLFKRMQKNLDCFSVVQAKHYFFLNLISPTFEFIGIVLIAGIVLFSYFSFSSSSAMKFTGTVALFLVVAWRVLPAVSRLTSSITLIRGSLPSILKVLDYLILFEKHGHDDDALTQQLKFDDKIEANNVVFKYEGASKNAISNVSFSLNKGQAIGLVGPSGAGKSTFVDILIGFLEPNSGEVLIDGKKLSRSNRKSWMEIIGYVPQTPYISDDTLLANIAFGIQSTMIDREWAERCCEMAHINEFSGALPLGLDTPIGERGVCLSGGQRQRVAIARALYGKPEIIIFDEATSALDHNTESHIQKMIEQLHGKISMIIIAHRLSTVEHCDFVLWIDKGVKRMFGDPEHVLKAYKLEQSE